MQASKHSVDFPYGMVNICPDSLCAHCTRSAIGFLFIALMAFLAAIWVLTNNPSQKYACRSRSTVLDSRRAMSPSSSDESFMMSDQLLPAAHASITPAPHVHLQHQTGSHSLPLAASIACMRLWQHTAMLCLKNTCTTILLAVPTLISW